MSDTSASTTTVRGGQAAIHWVRMGRQVVRWALLLALGVSLVYFGFRVMFWSEKYDWYLAYKYLHADTVIAITKDNERQFILYEPNGDQVITTAGAYLSDARVQTHFEAMTANAKSWALQSLIPGLLTLIATVALFGRLGSSLGTSSRVRGSVLVEPEELKKVMERKWADWRKERGKTKKDEYRYTIAGVPYPPDAPMVHTQMIGTTGGGKTVAMMELLDQIRAAGDKAVIYDRMGSFTAKFYNEETDVILNPFDERDAGWSPFADADTGPGFAAMADAMIPAPRSVSDPFWSSAARSVFRSLAETLSRSGRTNVEDLSRLILKSDLTTLAETLKDTSGGAMIDLTSPKTAQSVRTSVIEPLEFLEYLKHRETSFSVGDWVREGEPGFLFLSGQVHHAAATRNLISVAIEIAVNAAMTCGPSERPRIWFFIDELPSLNYLPCLDQSLAELRQFGGCVVLGYQVFAKLEDIYGPKVAEAISGTVNNTFVFTTPDEPTARRCSNALGQEDVMEQSEGMSIGAHEARDGVSFSHRRLERPIATPSEIMDLQQRECFIRFAYNSPRTRLIVPYKHREIIAPSFVPPKPEDKDEGAAPNPKPPRSGASAPTSHDEDGVVLEGEVVDEPVETLDRPLLPVPVKRRGVEPAKKRRGEEQFLEQAETWFRAKRGPISPKTGDYEVSFSDAHRQALIDHFVIHRLRGVAASEVPDMTPDETLHDPDELRAQTIRLAENTELLRCFLERQRRREEEEARTEELRQAQRAERERARARAEAEAAATEEVEDPVEAPSPSRGCEETQAASDETAIEHAEPAPLPASEKPPPLRGLL